MRRAVDVVVSGLALLVTSPVIGVAAVVVAATMGRPVLFRQRRSGLDGAEFTLVKMRTMRPATYVDEPDENRLSRTGRVLRNASLDELPQLVNVLRGDMSLIGPRPTLPEQVARYTPRQRGRLAVRPGITGWAQVNGRNSLSWPERIELDLWYIEHRRLSLDLRIVGLTVVRLLRPQGVTGAEGVNPGFPDALGGGSDGEPR
jgi:lipopolysaccharide/colanic/teichoic acid biosynthesis glycosyltransferase